MNRQSDRQMDTKTDRHITKWTMDKSTNAQIDKWTDR